MPSTQDAKVIDFLQISANATREYYLNWGWQLTPVKFKGKAPIMSKWNTHVLDYETFIAEYGNTPHNLGLILGKKQIDIDLDRPEARALAPLLLPPTRRFGRKTAPNSHFIYNLAPSFEEKGVKSRKWSLPASIADADKAVIVELRGNSAQTVVPPSIHTSGEHIKWHGFMEGEWEDDFAQLDDLELIVSACDTMAFLTLMSVVWSQMDGNRHDLALATTGLLLKSGTNIDPEAVYDMMDWVMTTAGDEEKPARLRNEVTGTISRWKNGDITQGYKRLAELLPADVMVSIKNWITEGAYTVPKFNEMSYRDVDAIGTVDVSESHPYLVYVADEDSYRDVMLGTKYATGTALGRTFGRTLGKKAPKIIEERAPQVTARAYMPDKLVIDRGEVFNCETGAYVGETTCLNTWRGTHITPSEGDATDFKSHVSSLVDYNEELTEHLLDWIAFTVQKPCEKTAWAILMMHGQGCVDMDTEYLTPDGWVAFKDDYTGGKVAQWHPETGVAEFVTPDEYFVADCPYMYHFKHDRGLDQMLSPNHRMMYYSEGSSEVVVKSAFELARQERVRGGFPCSFKVEGKGVDISDADLRLQIAVMADGYFPSSTSRCIVSIKKERKRLRLEGLLEGRDYNYYYKEIKGGDYRHVFTFDAPIYTKEFPAEWREMSLSQKEIIKDEVFHWDGAVRKGEGKEYFTTSKSNAEFIQYVLVSSGVRANIGVDERSDKYKGGACYTVHASFNRELLTLPRGETELVPTVDGKMYCFKVPSSFLVFRRNGKVFCSGNTGKTSLGDLIGKLVGESNYSTPDSNAVNSQFNNWLIDTRFILMDEIKSANNKWDLLDRLKPLITDTTVSVNIKGGAQKFQRNYCQIWMNTNHAFPMAVSEGDRRLFIYKSKTIYMSRDQIAEHIAPWYKGGDYFKWAHSADGLSVILGYLMARDLSGFNPHASAPMTESRAELVADSSSDIEDWITEAYHLKQAPLKSDIIRLSDVVKAYKDEFNKNVSAKRVGAIIRPLAQVSEGILPNNRTVRIDGVQMRTIAIRDIVKWTDAIETACAKEYKRGVGAVAGAPF